MTLNDYVARLKQQISADESKLAQDKKRLELVQRIKANVEATRNSNFSSLNKSWEDLTKSGDPVQVKLYGLPNIVASPFLDAMLNRTMGEKEYTFLQDATEAEIAQRAKQIYHQRLLDAHTDVDRIVASMGYRHIQEYLIDSSRIVRRTVKKLAERLLP